MNDSWRGAAKGMGFLAAAAAALVAGFVLAAFIVYGSLVILILAGVPLLGVALLLVVLSIAWTLWLFLGPAASEVSWRGAAKRMSFLLTAGAAAVVAGTFLAAPILGYEVIGGVSLLRLLVIPLLLLPFAGAAKASVCLVRRSRIPQRAS